MAEEPQRSTRPRDNPFLRKLNDYSLANSTQLLGFLALEISSAILLFFTGLTLSATVLSMIFFMPFIILSTPIWLPVGAVAFISIAGFLSISVLGIAVLAGLTWMYKYLSGRKPVGSDRVDSARSRIADTANQMKDFAWDSNSGDLQSKAKDAAASA